MDINSLEESIEKPGYLLFVVTILLLLIVGWVNLISVQSETPVVFGWFSIPQSLFFVGYTVAMLRWSWLLRKPNDDAWFVELVQRLQNQLWLGLLVLGGLLIVLASLFIPSKLMDIWLFHPAVQATYMIAFVIFISILILWRWNDATKPKLWKFLGFAIAAAVIIEVGLQLATLAGISPLTTSLAEAVGPYDRIYYVNQEGETINKLANSYGWYYPEFELAEDSHIVAVLGDAYIKGYGVEVEENIGVQLNNFVNSDADLNLTNPEVISLGFPDLGTGLYLSDTTVEHNRENYEFQDLIVYFDVSDDFQIVTGPSDEAFYYFKEGDELKLDPASWHFRHDAAHYTLWGSSDGFKPNRFLNSHIMLSKGLQRIINLNDSTSPKVAAPQEDVALPNSFMFYDETDDNGLFIVDKQLEQLVNGTIKPNDINMILVTIPAFTEKFYAQSGADWSTEFGEADLMLPENELRKMAESNGISFLGMGDYLKASGMTTDEIKSLFMDDGLGYFTAEGHRFFAQAAYECFYAQSLNESHGCDIR